MRKSVNLVDLVKSFHKRYAKSGFDFLGGEEGGIRLQYSRERASQNLEMIQFIYSFASSIGTRADQRALRVLPALTLAPRPAGAFMPETSARSQKALLLDMLRKSSQNRTLTKRFDEIPAEALKIPLTYCDLNTKSVFLQNP